MSQGGAADAEILDIQLATKLGDAEWILEEAREKFIQNSNDPAHRLEYAALLTRFPCREARFEAVELLKDLIHTTSYCKDGLYYSALALYALGEYDTARRYAEDLRRAWPDSHQIATLHSAVAYRHAERKKNDEATKAGLAVGVIALGLGIMAIMSSRKK